MAKDRLIERAPSLIVACDVDSLARLDVIAEAAAHIPIVSGLKIGMSLVCRFGMDQVAGRIRERTSVRIIYDQQKAGTDIPDLAKELVAITTPVDAVIIFPMAGPETQRAYTGALQDAGKTVLIGGTMTHAQYVESDGGYISTTASRRILELATSMGVRDFVVPSTKPEAIIEHRKVIEEVLAEGAYDLYSPGLVAQGGAVSELRKAAGPRWHAIVGRAIYAASNPAAAMAQLSRTL
jgi:orotidine-5'-phosphate decarboxylase